MGKQTIIVLSGPTASGKTSLSIDIANLFNGEIISCDAMQIYKDLNIGTAKATTYEQSKAKHHLIDIVNCYDEFSVQQYVESAKEKIEEIASRGKIPIIVGGTGFYIKSLIYPYTFCSAPKDESIREKYNLILKKEGKEYLYQLLKQIDKDSYDKIHLNDTKRVIRALEIYDITGQKKSNFISENLESQYNVIFIVLNLPREELYLRINDRVEQMFKMGLIDEFNFVLNKYKNLNKNSQSMQAIGYKELFNLIDNSLTLDEVKELIKKNSRNYAKRQITFFKGFKEATWFNPYDKEKIFNYIKMQLANYNN